MPATTFSAWRWAARRKTSTPSLAASSTAWDSARALARLAGARFRRTEAAGERAGRRPETLMACRAGDLVLTATSRIRAITASHRGRKGPHAGRALRAGQPLAEGVATAPALVIARPRKNRTARGGDRRLRARRFSVACSGHRACDEPPAETGIGDSLCSLCLSLSTGRTAAAAIRAATRPSTSNTQDKPQGENSAALRRPE